jgi:hypothetical protein
MSFFQKIAEKANAVAAEIGAAATGTTTTTTTTSATTTGQPENTYEKSFDSQYVGCYRDSPTMSYMPKELANVNDIGTCINNAKNMGYQYAALSNGNKCRASNHPDFEKGESVNRTFCNVPCPTPNTGHCGGQFFNQVYKTGERSSPSSVGVAGGNEKFGMISARGDYLTYFLVIAVVILLYYELVKRHVI